MIYLKNDILNIKRYRELYIYILIATFFIVMNKKLIFYGETVFKY